MKCGKCGAHTQLNLCTTCQTDLKNMLNGLHTRTTPNGKTMPGWLTHLAEAATGQTRLGNSPRRSKDHTTPLPCNLTASQLLEDANAILNTWAAHTIHTKPSQSTS